MCSSTVQLLKSTDLGRHSLLYLKEIGHGWFGKVRDAFITNVRAHFQSLQMSNTYVILDDCKKEKSHEFVVIANAWIFKRIQTQIL